MPQMDHPGSGRSFHRFAQRRKRFALGWAALLALPAASSGGEAQVASIRPGDVGRSGCLVHMGAKDTNGIAEGTADCWGPILPERVIEILRNQDDIDKVLSSVSESTMLPDGRVVQVHTMGWAVADRQVTLLFREYALLDGGYHIDFRRASDQRRPREGTVPIARDRGWWEIPPYGEDGTHLRYKVRYDAGGNLRPWIVRKWQRGRIAQALEEVRRAAELAERQRHTPPIAAR
jgi:hypothetical protein